MFIVHDFKETRNSKKNVKICFCVCRIECLSTEVAHYKQQVEFLNNLSGLGTE